MSTARRYRAYYIEPGLADYTAEGIGAVLVQKDALDKMNPSFVGMPVVNFAHTDKEPEELFDLSREEIEEFADGVVAATGYDDDTGWYWADMLVWDESTQENLDGNEYSVSCAYDVDESSNVGETWHNLPYTQEVLDGTYKHMAVVPNPRYENAWVIQNSKPEENQGVTKKLFGKTDERQNQKPDEMENTEEGYVMKPDGSKMPIGELVSEYREMKNKDDEMDNAGKMYNEEDMVNIDGEEVSVRDMMSKCGMMPMENEAEEDDMENASDEILEEDMEPVIDESRQNSMPQEKKRENFRRVKNAARQSPRIDPSSHVNTESKRLARGAQRYGSTVSQGGK